MYEVLEAYYATPYHWHPNGAVMLAHDDGYKSMLTITAPIEKARGMRSSLMVVEDIVNSGDPIRLSWADCQVLSDDGFLICNHTHSHVVPFDGLNAVQKEAELTDCSVAIQANVITGVPLHPGIRGDYYVSYPGSALGNNVDTITAMTAAGMRTGFESGFTMNIPKTTPPFRVAIGNVDLSVDEYTIPKAKNYIATAAYAGNVGCAHMHAVDTAHDIAAWTGLLDWIVAQGIPVITIDDYYQREIA